MVAMDTIASPLTTADRAREDRGSRRTWADIGLGLTATETSRLSSSLDTVFDALQKEAA